MSGKVENKAPCPRDKRAERRCSRCTCALFVSVTLLGTVAAEAQYATPRPSHPQYAAPAIQQPRLQPNPPTPYGPQYQPQHPGYPAATVGQPAPTAHYQAAPPYSQQAVQQAYHGYGPGQFGSQQMLLNSAAPVRGNAILQVQQTDPDEALEKPNPHVWKMPEPEYKMDVIQNRSQLIMTRSRIVRTDVANPSIALVVQYSPTELAILGLDLGSTTIALWFEGDPNPTIYVVTTIRDPALDEQRKIDYGNLERKLTDLFPNSFVQLIPLSYKIIVKGQARNTEEAAQILQIVRGEFINQYGGLGGPQPLAGAGGNIGNNDFAGDIDANDRFSDYIVNMLEVPGDYQVMLRVRIAELNRSQLRRMGVDWSMLFNNGRNFLTGGIGGAGATLTGIFESGDIQLFINWLASNGTVSVLAEPVLTVMSGEQASFLAGGEFAVPTIVGISGAAGQTTFFRGFGTSLFVTPTVVERDLVKLRIIPEFSQVNQGNAVGGIPGVDSRRVQTTVQLREGQTIVLGGLLSRQIGTEVTRIPLLGELPYVGAKLFSGKRSTEDQTELLILVSPEIIRPMDADEVPPMPNYYVTHPDDIDLYHLARTEGNPDTEVYQVPPFGHGSGHAVPVGYRLHNPAPASPMYAPVPTGAFGGGQPAMPNTTWNGQQGMPYGGTAGFAGGPGTTNPNMINGAQQFGPIPGTGTQSGPISPAMYQGSQTYRGGLAVPQNGPIQQTGGVNGGYTNPRQQRGGASGGLFNFLRPKSNNPRQIR